MLYENIIKILKKSKDDNVDLYVARDKLIAEGHNADDISTASGILKQYYKPVIRCWVSGERTLIKSICTMYENEKDEELEVLINKIMEHKYDE